MRLVKGRDAPTVDWDDQTGFTSDIANVSPEHHGAHERLLELAVEMDSDFEPYGKRYQADIELQPLSSINQVFERLEHGDMASRVVSNIRRAKAECECSHDA